MTMDGDREALLKYCKCSIPIELERNFTLEESPQNAECLEVVYGNTVGKYLKPYAPTEVVVYSMIYIIISSFGLLGNGLVIFAVVRKKAMRNSANIYIANLALANFLLGLVLYPFLWYPETIASFPFGTFFCKTATAIPGSNIYCSTLTITLMAIDRYYTTIQTTIQAGRLNSCAYVSASAIWVVSILLSLPFLLYYEVAAFPGDVFMNMLVCPNNTLCDNPVLQSKSWPRCVLQAPSFLRDEKDAAKAVNIIQTTFLYVIPILVLVVFNIRLMRYLSHNSMAARQSEGNTDHSVKVSQAMLSAKRRHNRATRLLNAMAVSYGVLWAPFTLISLLYDFDYIIEDKVTLRIDHICKSISMISICVNPFLYGYLNTNFNREFRKIFSRLPFIGRCLPLCSKKRNGRRREEETMGESMVNGTHTTMVADNTVEMKTLLRVSPPINRASSENVYTKV